MRNRSEVTRGAMLAVAPILVLSSLLGAQTARQELARAAWVPPMATLGPAPIADLNGPPPPPAVTAAAPTVIRWYHGVAFLGAIAALSSLDEPVRDEVQGRRSSGGDDVARLIRHVGQPEVYATVALGTVAAGLVSGNSKITRAGGRISSGIALGGLVSSILKLGVGRRRPFSSEDQYTFGPFSKVDASWPSGHTMTAFALAAGISDEVHSTPVTILMYTLAAGVGWSRMNDNKHWLTDVAGGAAIGITSAKLMNGRWRVFGLSAPRFLMEPSGGAGLAWRATF